MATLTYQLPASLTFENHTDIEQDILAKIGEGTFDSVVFDAQKTEYISSAGLRVILSIKKKVPDVSVINASSVVYDIFRMTGFTSLINVDRAFREISTEGCEIIGQGAHGTVYRLAPDTIVKVYGPDASLEEIKKERELSKQAFVLGLPTAIALDIVRVGDQYGTVFELLNAMSCVNYIKESPANVDDFINKAVALLKKVHKITIDDDSLPNLKEATFSYLDRVKQFLNEQEYQDVKQIINDIPETKTLIHGDFHIKNILVSDKELMLIDMDTLAVGHPVFELANMCNTYYEFGIVDPEAVTNFLTIPLETANRIWYESAEKYCEDLSEQEYQALINKARLIGCVRALHFFNKRNYEKNMIEKCLIDLRKSIELIKEK